MPRTRAKRRSSASTATASGAFVDFLPRGLPIAVVVLVFVVLFKFTDAFAGVTDRTPSCSISAFTRTEYAVIIKGVGLLAAIAGGFAGGFIARALPLAASLGSAAFCRPPPTSPSRGRRSSATTLLAHRRDHGRELHQRHRHGDFRRLSLGALPQSAAYGHAIRAAHGAVGVGRTYSRAGAGYVAAATGWFWFFVICALAALPSLMLLVWLQARGHFKHLAPKRS